MATASALFVLLIIVLIIVALIYDLMRPGMVFFSALIVLMISGVISSEHALAGFSNKGMLTIAALFLVSAGVRYSGALDMLARSYLPKRRGRYLFTISKILLPVASVSAFLNNTPVVIIFAPIIKNWAEKMNLSAQKFLIPLSYATILGGMCTLIGTSTNLVVHGLMLENGLDGLTMFETGKVGVIIAIVGFIYLATIGHRLLPGKKDQIKKRSTTNKRYFLDANITKQSALIGSEITNGRSPLMRDIRIQTVVRHDKKLDTLNQTYTLEADDKLVIRVKSHQLLSLLNNKLIELEAANRFKKFETSSDIEQIEAVISPRFPGINRTINDFDFITHYHAEVIAVYRNGETISDNIGSFKMKAGDSLVMLASRNFIKNWGDSQIFYLTSSIGELPPPRYRGQRAITLILLLLMIIGATVGQSLPDIYGNKLDMFYFAALTAVIMTWINIIPNRKYTKFITWDVLITIACAFGISSALHESGAADLIATKAINFSKAWGPLGVLITLYLITNLFTEFITNNAAAALVVPIALSAASQLNVSPDPFLIAICISASASFATPIGYQTNLLVQGLGNYKFHDYLKVGLPLNLIAFIISIIIIPIFWPF
ncbi:MAG: SLC13 family permease [Mangrovibacterium sp.]